MKNPRDAADGLMACEQIGIFVGTVLDWSTRRR